MPEDTGSIGGTGSTAAFAGTAGPAAVEVAEVAELVAFAVAVQISEPRAVGAVAAVAVTTAMLEPVPAVVPGGPTTAMTVAGETREVVVFVSADQSALEDGLLLEPQRFAPQIVSCP